MDGFRFSVIVWEFPRIHMGQQTRTNTLYWFLFFRLFAHKSTSPCENILIEYITRGGNSRDATIDKLWKTLRRTG